MQTLGVRKRGGEKVFSWMMRMVGLTRGATVGAVRERLRKRAMNKSHDWMIEVGCLLLDSEHERVRLLVRMKTTTLDGL